MRCLFLILTGLFMLNEWPILYLNIFTHSLPYGVYLKIEDLPKRGDFAVTCLTRTIAHYGIQRQYLAEGVCPTGTVRVLKIIQGLPGDRFVMNHEFLQLNGHSYRIMDKDSSGRKLSLFYPEGNGVLASGKYLLVSNFVKNSWDSRYWGPVSIQFLLKPLVLFENVKKSQIPYP